MFYVYCDVNKASGKIFYVGSGQCPVSSILKKEIHIGNAMLTNMVLKPNSKYQCDKCNKIILYKQKIKHDKKCTPCW